MIQSREDFLKERMEGVGGSDIKHVLNLKPYGCARMLFHEKIGHPVDYEPEDKAIFERGRRLEPLILDMVQQRYPDSKVDVMPPLERRKEKPWQQCHPDGYKHEHGKTSVIESKTANMFIWQRMKKTGLPEDYICQLQWAMHVGQHEEGLFAVLWADGWQFECFPVAMNRDLIWTIAAQVDDFWHRVKMVRNSKGFTPARLMGNAPDRLDPDDPRCQVCVYRRSCQGNALIERAGSTSERKDLVKLTGTPAAGVQSAVTRYWHIKELADEATDMLDAAKAEIKSAIGDHTAVEIDGARIYHRVQISKRVDTTKLKQKYKEVYEDCTAESVSRPLRVFAI